MTKQAKHAENIFPHAKALHLKVGFALVFVDITKSKGGINMLHIKFKYADAMSNWQWREQECTVSSVSECIKIYGLGVDCEYEIISIEEVS